MNGLVMGALGQSQPRELLLDMSLRHGAWDSVQTGMKQKVGGDGELEVEGGLLKDDTESRQRRYRIARHVMAHHLDAPGIRREQAGEQLEQRRLAGAIGTEQSDEFSRLGLQAHAVDGANRPVALDDIVQQQSWSGW